MTRTILGFATSFALACNATPDLHFEADDASSAGSTDTGANVEHDAASDSARDSTASMDATPAQDATRAPLDAAPVDAAETSTSCSPTQLPPGATACCAGTPCVDRQGQGCNCGDCAQSPCPGSGRWCCFDSQGNLSCKPNANACH
jgi:hypothetical protein